MAWKTIFFKRFLIKGFDRAKTVVIHYDILSSFKFCQTTRYSGMLFFIESTKICLTTPNLVIYSTFIKL